MILVLSLFLLGAGFALITNTIVAPTIFPSDLPTRDALPRRRGVWPVTLGSLLAVAGLVLLVLAPTTTP